jgi:two-component system sensor histidine kinase/response regulator
MLARFRPEATAPSEPRAAAAPRDDLVPAIEGLDAAAGLRRCGGNARLYRGLLQRFAREQIDAAERYDDALACGRTAEAEHIAHALRGVAGNLGFDGIAADAAQLERAAREGVPVAADVRHRLGSRLAAAGSAGGRGDASSADRELRLPAPPDPRRLAAFRRALDEDDAEAAEHFLALREALAPRLGIDAAHVLQRAIDGFDFETAKKTLDAALGGLHGND